jgi:hypothetical protein
VVADETCDDVGLNAASSVPEDVRRDVSGAHGNRVVPFAGYLLALAATGDSSWLSSAPRWLQPKRPLSTNLRI